MKAGIDKKKLKAKAIRSSNERLGKIAMGSGPKKYAFL